MANLVPFLLDKDTGKIVAKQLTSASGSFETSGYVHVQSIGNNTWTINHDGNTNNVLVQIYGTDNKLVLPDEVIVIDNNNLIVTFSGPQVGKALLMLFQ